ncbi:IS110 family transposase [Streptomyces brasiliscabiei]|uniref:IS110 family transposase n=1 Tax=Streptomyces brasiliscabiei TaxID=2736302 RepID=UPI001C103E88|nr:transposase [Streptomyces brasiliscabiei]
MPDNGAALLELLGGVLELSDDSAVTCLLHLPGRTHATDSYWGNGRTDVIADQARMRRDLHSLQETSQIVVDLKILTARRLDLSADRNCTINRLRAQPLAHFAAMERACDYSTSKTALIPLTDA